jgi:hypothetical protein
LWAGLSLGTVQSGRLVAEEPGGGSNRLAGSHSRSGACSTPVWLLAIWVLTAARRLVDQSQASVATLSLGWLAAPDAGASA